MAELLVLVGAAFTFVAGLGSLRFTDVFSRMHALTKASTLGLLLVVAGAVVRLDHPNDRTSLILAALLHVLTSPVGSNLLSRATYFAEGIPHGIDTIDELADAARPADEAPGAGRGRSRP
jgi:multicomponent Na+:H+ antiporter subunit G